MSLLPLLWFAIVYVLSLSHAFINSFTLLETSVRHGTKQKIKGLDRLHKQTLSQWPIKRLINASFPCPAKSFSLLGLNFFKQQPFSQCLCWLHPRFAIGQDGETKGLSTPKKPGRIGEQNRPQSSGSGVTHTLPPTPSQPPGTFD